MNDDLDAAQGPPISTPPTRLLTINQAADELQVSRCTMQRLILDGVVASIRIGRIRRVPSPAIDAFIEDRLEEERSIA